MAYCGDQVPQKGNNYRHLQWYSANRLPAKAAVLYACSVPAQSVDHFTDPRARPLNFLGGGKTTQTEAQ